jgi:RNA polymerase sigma-70 factor (ECF subfamily)
MFLRRQSSWNTSSDQANHQLVAIDHVLECAKNGEAEALSTLYHHFLPGVFSYIALRTADRSTAEDLTSEVFLKMVEGIHKVKANNEAGFAAWLLQVARITVADYYRKREKQPPLVSLEATLREDDGMSHKSDAIAASDPTSDPVQWSEAREQWSTVVQAINTLTEEQRQVLISRLILGYDVATVAQMMGKKANAVKALQFRALQSLERLLAKRAQPEKLLSHVQQQEEAP